MYFQEYFQSGELTVEVWKHVSAECENSVSLTTHVIRETRVVNEERKKRN